MSNLEHYCKPNIIECGCDEVGRGCLSGPTVAASVIWSETISEYVKNIPEIRDSKKMTYKSRKEASDFIKEHATDYAIAFVDASRIDEINIRNAAMEAMHKSLDKLELKPDHIVVDGNYFKNYPDDKNPIDYTTCIKGDDKYYSIAAASILAKVAKDEYIENLIKENPELEKYGWLTNACYGTKTHLDAIKEYGITKYHRKTFGPCKNLT